jgi:hypothetical protein
MAADRVAGCTIGQPAEHERRRDLRHTASLQGRCWNPLSATLCACGAHYEFLIAVLGGEEKALQSNQVFARIDRQKTCHDA